MKDLTPAAHACLSERNGAPVVLVTLTTRNATGEVVTRRFASRSADDGSGGYRIGGTGPAYEPALITLSPITREYPSIAHGTLTLANPTLHESLHTTSLSTHELDGALCTIAVLFSHDDETPEDCIPLAWGTVEEARVTVGGIELSWREQLFSTQCEFPRRTRITAAEYPYAPQSIRNRILPMVLGDLRGRAFDMGTPASGAFPHAPVLTINAARQRIHTYDPSIDAAHELLMRIGDHVIEVPNALLSGSADYIQIGGTAFHLWMPPFRVNATTDPTVLRPESACNANLSDYAHVPPYTALVLDFAGAAASLGVLGTVSPATAADVTVYTVYSKTNQANTYPGRITITLDGTAISGHANIGLNGNGIAVDVQEIGDHLADWADLQRLGVTINGVISTSGVDIRRVIVRVRFQCADVGSAYERRFYRSMAGFTESATDPLDDYINGTYLRGDRMSDPVEHPADLAEAILRSRTFGFSLRASSLRATSATLANALSATSDTCDVTDASAFTTGDFIMIDEEALHVIDINGSTLSVARGARFTQRSCHLDGTPVYIAGNGAHVDSFSFRVARSKLTMCAAIEHVINGAMEGVYSGGVADGWAHYDPDANAMTYAGAGYVGHRAQGIFRTSIGGTDPGVEQIVGDLEAGATYRVECYVKSQSGASAVRIDTIQSTPFSSSFPTGSQWKRVTFDLPATDTTLTLRIIHAGGIGSLLIDGVSVRRVLPWRMAFSLTSVTNGQQWFERVFSPQTGFRLGLTPRGEIAAIPHETAAEAIATFDSSCICVDCVPSCIDGVREISVPAIRTTRSTPDTVASNVTVRFAPNHVTGSFDGHTSVTTTQRDAGQTVVSVTAGAPLDTLTMSDSAALAPKAGANEATNISTSGDMLTVPSGNLLTAGVRAGDWLVVRVSHGTYLGRVREVLNATQARLVERLPHINEPGQWSVSADLLTAGGEIFAVCETPTPTNATIIRQLDANAFPTNVAMQPDDTIYRVTSASDDGAGASDQQGGFRENRERRAVANLARHGTTRSLIVDAPYIRDRHTAVALRNQLFDAAQNAWIVHVTTDLSTLTLDVGDHVTIRHNVLPSGVRVGQIIRQSVSVLTGRIEYTVRCGDGW